MRALGVPGIQVDRPTIQLIADAYGVKELGPERERTMARYRTLAANVSPAWCVASVAAWRKDRRDTMPPRGDGSTLPELLEALCAGARTTNDVGIVTLPDGTGHMVMAIFVKAATGDAAVQGRTFAQVARAAFDYSPTPPTCAHRPPLPA